MLKLLIGYLLASQQQRQRDLDTDRIEWIGNQVYVQCLRELRAAGMTEYGAARGAMAASKTVMRELSK